MRSYANKKKVKAILVYCVHGRLAMYPVMDLEYNYYRHARAYNLVICEFGAFP